MDILTEEIRDFRRQLAERDGNDICKIFERLRNLERTSGRTYVTLAPRPPRPMITTEQPIASAPRPHCS